MQVQETTIDCPPAYQAEAALFVRLLRECDTDWCIHLSRHHVCGASHPDPPLVSIPSIASAGDLECSCCGIRFHKRPIYILSLRDVTDDSPDTFFAMESGK